MFKILGLYFSVLLVVFGLLSVFEEDNSTTREHVRVENGKTVVTHKQQKVHKVTETVDPEYKKKNNLHYY